MSWLQKLLPPRIKATPGVTKKSMPEGLWVKCPACEAVLYRTDLEKNLNVCPKCGHHGRLTARERIDQVLDPEGRYEMGSVVGERFVRGVRVAYDNRIAFVCITSSGGARMQEGVHSLFQMAKTTAVLQELSRAKLPFVSLLTDPTMGGVSASFAFVADIVLAEPGALIGFAGPRVIEQTVREKLPEGFQRAEFLLEKGAIDKIVDRRHLRE